jgi:hypothetical protein
MTTPKQIEVIIDREGISRHLLDEENSQLYTPFGDVTGGYRNSHVDQTLDLRPEARAWLQSNTTHVLAALLWWADMLPVGNVVLGPFETRTEALAAEIAWLRENNLPTTREKSLET